MIKNPKKSMFLSADRLGIKEWERNGLIAFCEAVNSGTVHHFDDSDLGHTGSNECPLFDLSAPARKYNCGTVACIGGFIHLTQMNKGISDANDYVMNKIGILRGIFFPDDGFTYRYVTVKSAGKFVHHFLTTGRVKDSLLREK